MRSRERDERGARASRVTLCDRARDVPDDSDLRTRKVGGTNPKLPPCPPHVPRRTPRSGSGLEPRSPYRAVYGRSYPPVPSRRHAGRGPASVPGRFRAAPHAARARARADTRRRTVRDTAPPGGHRRSGAVQFASRSPSWVTGDRSRTGTPPTRPPQPHTFDVGRYSGRLSGSVARNRGARAREEPHGRNFK